MTPQRTCLLSFALVLLASFGCTSGNDSGDAKSGAQTGGNATGGVAQSSSTTSSPSSKAKGGDTAAAGGSTATSDSSPSNGGSSTKPKDSSSTGGASSTSAPQTSGGTSATQTGSSSAPVTGGTKATNKGGASSKGGATSTGGATDAGGATSTGGKSSTGGAGGATGGTFTLTIPGWTSTEGCSDTAKTSCAPLPTEITRSGAGTSPELRWTGAPEGTKSFVILLQDLNNKTAHWILWNIPATVTTLAANVDRTTPTPATPAGSQQCGKGDDAGTSDGYYGPGAPCNAYEFVVYALSVASFSPTDATEEASVRTQLQALGSSILGSASLRGKTNTGC